jgi:hypothetical protein
MRTEFRYGISAAAFALIAVFTLVPERGWSSLPAVCVYRNLLGIECLGCGMTRALAAIAHGRVADAVALNAGVLLAAPALVIAFVQGLLVRR